jgi:hypothetical protein
MSRSLVFRLAGAVCAMPFAPTHVSAQVTTSAGASVLRFPLVVAGSGQNSISEPGNGPPDTVFVHCVYAPGGPGGRESGDSVRPRSVSHQPTHWRASKDHRSDTP